MDVLAVEVDVAEVERDGLGRAEPTGVDELDQRSIANGERSVAVDGVDRVLDLRERWCLGKTAWPTRRECRIWNARGPERVADEGADRREPSRDRRRRETTTGAPELRRVVGEHPDVDVVDGELALTEPAREVPQVGSVRAPRGVRKRGTRKESVDREPGVHV
jgi:hypothetical protein